MDVRTFMVGVFLIGPFVALAVSMIANRLDRRDGYAPEAPTPMYVLCALPVAVVLLVAVAQAVLNADTAVQDPCSLLEPYSWKWWALGCYWGSTT